MKLFRIFIVVFLTLISQSLSAQHPKGREEGMKGRAEAMRVAYITREVGLTETEAQKFWPVYNEYHERIRNIRKQARQNLAGYNSQLSDEDLNRLASSEESSRKAEYDTHIFYGEKLRQILGVRKYVLLRLAEENFKRDMIKTLRDRHE